MVRATTGGVMKTYRSNLMNSFINMNANRNTVLSQRIFNSFAEDPATAARAFRLRKSRMTVESQHGICTDVMKKYETAFSCLQSNDDVLCTKDGVYGEYMKTLTGTTLKMLNDPTGDARTQLSKVLDQMSQTLVQTMNQKYGDNFIFAGADGHNVPFEIRNDGRLYYRGVWVDSSIPNVFTDGKNNFVAVSADGKVISDPENYKGDVYYLNMDNTKIVTKEEYDKLYAVPKLQMDPYNTGKFLECDYDADGNLVYMPGGGYYMPVDENDKPTEPIAKEAYEEIVARNESLLRDDSSASQFNLVQSLEDVVDKDGDNPKAYDSAGQPINDVDSATVSIYYHYTVDGEIYVVSKDVYDKHMKEFPSDDKFPMFYADGHVQGEEVSGGLHTIGGEPVRYLCKGDDGQYYWLDSAEYEESQLVHANTDGTYDPEGDCYVVFDKSNLMTPEEYEQQKTDWEKLQYLAQEAQFVDIGFGFQENDRGKLIESSAFNAALNGINFLGYGVDEDGDPKNLYSLVQKMRAVAESVGPDDDWSNGTWEEFNRLVGKFEAGVSDYQTQFANLAASTTKLENQQGLLEDNFYNLQEQYSDLEDVDMVDAITSFIWAEYCYNAALKVGNSILSESLMDYLN